MDLFEAISLKLKKIRYDFLVILEKIFNVIIKSTLKMEAFIIEKINEKKKKSDLKIQYSDLGKLIYKNFNSDNFQQILKEDSFLKIIKKIKKIKDINR